MMTDAEKVAIYEQFLHLLQLHAEVVMNSEKVRTLINNACRWSYAHRVGNGELTEEEQARIVERALQNLTRI